MKKWQELTINSFMNLSIALIAGGVLKLVLDFTSINSSGCDYICRELFFISYDNYSQKFR